MADNQQGNNNGATQEEIQEPVRAVPTGSVTWKFQFGTLSGTKTFTYNYADRSADETDVKAFIQTMIANGSIFKDPPLVAKAAWVETKTITEYDLEN